MKDLNKLKKYIWVLPFTSGICWGAAVNYYLIYFSVFGHFPPAFQPSWKCIEYYVRYQ